jgi:hypothetical protein
MSPLGFCGNSRKEQRSNIIITLAYNLGRRDVGYHGGRIATPNIGRFARERTPGKLPCLSALFADPRRADDRTLASSLRHRRIRDYTLAKVRFATTERALVDLVASGSIVENTYSPSEQTRRRRGCPGLRQSGRVEGTGFPPIHCHGGSEALNKGASGKRGMALKVRDEAVCSPGRTETAGDAASTAQQCGVPV